MRSAIRHDGNIHRPAPRIALVASLGLAVALALGACGEAREQLSAEPATTTTSMCAHLPRDQGGCGLTFEEQRRLNLRYAERLPFEGSGEEAEAVAEEVRGALGRFSGQATNPAPDEVRNALARWAPKVQVTSNAVRTRGTAFAVNVQGGCVFGSVNAGAVSVEVGGFVRDGGCLASHGA